MRTEVNIFFTLLFICSFIVSVAFTNEQNESGYKTNKQFAEYTNPATISAASSHNELTEAYETVAAPLSDTSSMHGKNGEFEVYHQYVNVNIINLEQKYPHFQHGSLIPIKKHYFTK